MKASFISTASINFGLRNTTAQMQRLLPDLQLETVTGRNADSGLALGSKTAELASLRNDINVFDRLTDTNNLAAVRMRVAQSGMDRAASVGQDMTKALGLVFGDESQKGAVVTTAINALTEFTSALNSSVGGIFLFGGENSDNAPLAEYEGSAAQTAFRNAFQTNFGFAIDSPATSGISAAQMEDFITNVAEPIFLGAGWTTNVSVASDDVPDIRIGDDITLKGGVSANEDAFQKMMIGVVLASELYATEIGGGALNVAGKYALETIAEANGALTKVQGKLGLSQERVERANESIFSQKALLETFVDDLDGVDPYETAIQVNSLLTQIEVSYSVTARIQNLSLIQYLR